MATIQADSDCELITISKDDYTKVIEAPQNKRFEKLAYYLQSLSVFKTLSQKLLRQIAFFVQEKRFGLNKTVFKEGDQI